MTAFARLSPIRESREMHVAQMSSVPGRAVALQWVVGCRLWPGTGYLLR